MDYNLFFPEQITKGKHHYILYLHDRVLDRRVVTIHPYTWNENDHENALEYFGDWGNGGCDCNRSISMYDEMPENAPLDIENYGPDTYPCRSDHPLYPDNKILIEKIICLETGETIATNI